MNKINLFFNSQIKFIVISFITSFFGFAKSLFILKFFNFETLGLISLAQTFVSSISLTQIGVVTGGYRIFSYKKKSILTKVNSAVLVFFIMLLFALIIFSCISLYFYDPNIDYMLIILFVVLGVIALYSNWVINKLIGLKNIKTVNNVQIISAIGSLILTLTSIWIGYAGVIIAMFFQPIVIIMLSYYISPILRPKFNWLFFKKYIKIIISLGFIPYLTSALAILNTQIGRWCITITLGSFFLGKLFLPIVVVAVGSVFPAAISNLFFPKIIEKYEIKDFIGLSIDIKKVFWIIGFYCTALVLLILFCLNTVVMSFFPIHIESLNLVYISLPTIIFSSLSIPIVIYFNAAKKFNYILYGGILSSLSYIILMFFYVISSEISLFAILAIESISSFLLIVYNIYIFKKTFFTNLNLQH